MLLKDAAVGDTCIVQEIRLPFQMERRLEALGMTKNTPVFVVNRKGRGILIVYVRGTRLALGVNITENITVEGGDN